MNDFAELAFSLGRDVHAEVKTSLGADYATLTLEQMQSIETTGAKYIELQLRLKLTTDPAEIVAIKNKLQALESIVKDWKVWGAFAIEDAFWKGVQKVAATFGSFLGGLAGEAASRIIPGI